MSVGVGVFDGVGEGPAVGVFVGTQVTVTPSQVGPKVSWAFTLSE